MSLADHSFVNPPPSQLPFPPSIIFTTEPAALITSPGLTSPRRRRIMPDTFPANIYTSHIPGKGRGLFTSHAIEAGELVFLVDRPLLCVPSNRHLDETCYHCFLWLPKNAPKFEGDRRRLQGCMGCTVVRYCSKVSDVLRWGQLLRVSKIWMFCICMHTKSLRSTSPCLGCKKSYPFPSKLIGRSTCLLLHVSSTLVRFSAWLVVEDRMPIPAVEGMNCPRSLEEGLKERDVYSCTLSRPTQVVKLLTQTTELSIKVMGRLPQIRMQDLGSVVTPGAP